jgi:hypothetical protein
MNNGGGIEALEATTGKPLWHSQVGNLTAPPETFMLDGKQHVVAYVSGGLFMFVLNKTHPTGLALGNSRSPGHLTASVLPSVFRRARSVPDPAPLHLLLTIDLTIGVLAKSSPDAHTLVRRGLVLVS